MKVTCWRSQPWLDPQRSNLHLSFTLRLYNSETTGPFYSPPSKYCMLSHVWHASCACWGQQSQLTPATYQLQPNLQSPSLPSRDELTKISPKLLKDWMQKWCCNGPQQTKKSGDGGSITSFSKNKRPRVICKVHPVSQLRTQGLARIDLVSELESMRRWKS